MLYILSFLLLNCTLLWLQQSCRLCSQLPQEEGPGIRASVPGLTRTEKRPLGKCFFIKLADSTRCEAEFSGARPLWIGGTVTLCKIFVKSFMAKSGILKGMPFPFLPSLGSKAHVNSDCCDCSLTLKVVAL